MSKETTYQRLKRENAELRGKLYKLAVEPDSEESILIKADIIIKAGIEKAIFYGDSNLVATGIKTKPPCV